MPKIPQCDRRLFSSHDYHLVCAVHPTGPPGDTCYDFEADLELEGKRFVDFLGLQHQTEAVEWEPEGASFYNGELILQPRQRWTQEEQLQLLDVHPLFTGRCPDCGWLDDSI